MFRSNMLTRMLWRNRQTVKVLNATRSSPILCSHAVVNIREQGTGTVAIEDSYVKKFMKAVGLMDQSRTRLKLSGYFLYESVPAQVNYVEWFSKCEIEDTFSSWFYITELHVWLLMVRCMAEDATNAAQKERYVKGDGWFIRNCIVEALWADVSNRIKLLDGANPSIARKQVSELSEQFQAALVGYDEGLDDDRILAAAIWRRFYGMSPNVAPENVEKIVQFVRHQMANLDKLSSEQLKKSPKIDWLSIVN
ncbi:ubiquinol-cytochrome-c reductase complex assembly factor 1 [Plutella xylostella]|uniref:ubiquinol-cytochrome-c reductase complex assembly factor 1 n=1 Tax=Plutella xylostella TaxID=51655 RepID=UPI002032F93C|nr:ubiquinol-cytochrome-c reductase complex assembly factor 1 [Plutella xylostella]